MQAQTPISIPAPIARIKRLRKAPEGAQPADLTHLPLTRSAFVYKRLSSHEQKHKSIWSLEAQAALADRARGDGYRADQVVIEERDLGISGTKGAEHRPGLAGLIAATEAGQVESVYTVHVSRLTRDQSLIDGMQLGELFRRHSVIICLPTMRLNLRDKMHMRIWRIECERAADEIELMIQRLGVPKRYKAKAGYYDGRPVPLGYVLDTDKGSATYQRLIVHEPHAALVRTIFAAAEEGAEPRAIARRLAQGGVRIPPFGPDQKADAKRASWARATPAADGAFPIPPSLVQSVITNPAYLGWWVVGGEVAQTANHPPIIAEAVFLTAQSKAASAARRRSRTARATSPLLAGLVRCTRHDEVFGSSRARSGVYVCRPDLLAPTCTTLDARLVDGPVAEALLSVCDMHGFADEVLAHLEGEHERAQADARKLRRQLATLEKEIETLKQNLAVAHTRARAEIIFEQIEERQAKLREQSDAAQRPVARMLSAAQVATVRTFLADLRPSWARLPAELRREFLGLLVTAVEADAANTASLHLTIRLVSGQELRLWVERPATQRPGKRPWTAEEDAYLLTRYSTAPRAEVAAQLPGRSYGAVKERARSLGVRRRTSHGGAGVPWTAEEDAALKQHAVGSLSAAELAAATARHTPLAVQMRRHALGIRMPAAVRWSWHPRMSQTPEITSSSGTGCSASASRTATATSARSNMPAA